MSKSMYSLILMDEVVRAVDKLARQRGMNRSSLINHLLAEHLALKTPEKRVSEIFAHMEGNLETDSLTVAQKSEATLAVKGAVNFKYNPTIRYSVELASGPKAYTGWLRVSTRTQSRALIARLDMFYEMWMQIEQSCPPELRRQRPVFNMSDGRFSRNLIAEHHGEGLDHAVLGKALADYVTLLHNCQEIFFDSKNGMDIGTYKDLAKLYDEFLEQSEIVM
jgi:predicted transcriptional regulator